MFKLPDFLRLNTDLGDLEGEYRNHFLKLDIEQTRLALAFTVVAVTSLATIDYLIFGYSPKFYVHLLARGAFIVFSAFINYLLVRTTKVNVFETFALTWGLGLTILTLYVDFNRPSEFTHNVSLHMLMAFCAYILLPTQPRNRMITPILMTIGNIWIIFTIKVIPSPAWLGVTFSTYLLMHLGGIVTSLRWDSARKAEFRAEHGLQCVNQRLRQQAITDDLTGIYNRRYFIERANEEFERYQRYGHPFTLMIADMDLLKNVNDSHGHHAGDLAIRQFANLITKEKRTTDVLGRLGGEEFGLILPDTSLPQAMAVVNRIYEQRQLLVVRTAETDIHFRFTAGVAECKPDYHSMDDLFRSADTALYRGKANGRDRVEIEA